MMLERSHRIGVVLRGAKQRALAAEYTHNVLKVSRAASRAIELAKHIVTLFSREPVELLPSGSQLMHLTMAPATSKTDGITRLPAGFRTNILHSELHYCTANQKENKKQWRTCY